MIDYRTRKQGVTRFSILGMRHLEKLGTITKVIGYRKFVYLTGECGNFPVDREYVKVIGANGTATFGGFCWGYTGEGSRGLETLLINIGCSAKYAFLIAYQTPRQVFTGIDWELDISNGVKITIPNKRTEHAKIGIVK